MKKIKRFNKLIGSLTLLSPLAGLGFNDKYQNVQPIISENTKNYLNSVEPSEEQMGDVKVTVETDTESGYRKITGYVSESGTGALVISSDIDEIGDSAFKSGSNITSLDLSNATRLKVIGYDAFKLHRELSAEIKIPSSVTSIGGRAFFETNITSLDLSQATSLTTIGEYAFGSCLYIKDFKSTPENNKNFSLATNLGPNAQVLISSQSDGIWKDDSLRSSGLSFGDVIFPKNISKIKERAFVGTSITSLDLSNATSLTQIGNASFSGCGNLIGSMIFPKNLTTIDNAIFSSLDGMSRISYNNMNFYFLQTTIPTFQGWSWYSAFRKDQINVYVPEELKDQYLSSPNFNLTSDDNVFGWTFNSSSANINGNFNNINISSTDIGASTVTFNVSDCSPETLSQDTFTWSLVPTRETKTIPDGLGISKGKIYWNNVAEGTYTFKIQSSFDAWTKESNEIITINVTGDTPVPPEPTPEKSNIPLILGLLIGLGIPIILAISFIIWYATKKKKTTVKI